jgi:hypothetical protein
MPIAINDHDKKRTTRIVKPLLLLGLRKPTNAKVQ